MDDLLLDIGITFLIYIPIVIYCVKRVMNNKNISLKKRKLYLILTIINPLIGMLFYSIESNKKLKENYSPK